MGARGSIAFSEAADIVLTTDRVDRLTDAVSIAVRARRIAVQSALGGTLMSSAAVTAAVFALLLPAVGVLLQEGIDVAVVLNALRALRVDQTARPNTTSFRTSSKPCAARPTGSPTAPAPQALAAVEEVRTCSPSGYCRTRTPKSTSSVRLLPPRSAGPRPPHLLAGGLSIRRRPPPEPMRGLTRCRVPRARGGGVCRGLPGRIRA